MAKVLCHFTDFNHRPERRKKNTFGALGYYRTFKPAQQIIRHDIDFVGTEIASYGDTFEQNWENIFKKYDLIWIMHHVSKPNLAAQAFFQDKYKKRLVYDIDDNYLDLPESNPAYKSFKPNTKEDLEKNELRDNKAHLSTAFFFASAVSVSTEPLKERLQAHLRHIHKVEKPMVIVPNMNDVADWNFKPAPKHKDKIVIGYSGSNSHKDDLRMFFPALAKVMKKHKNVYFEFIGSIPKEDIPEYFKDCGFTDELLERIAARPSTATFLEYPEYLSQQKWDIGVAPLVDTAFTRSKSHIKWMEYSMYCIPTIASRVYPYFMDLCGRQTITDGETGFLCEPDEWEEKLERLILDKKLREDIGNRAYEFIKKEWQYKDFDMDSVVDTLLETPVKQGKSKK